MKRCESCRQLIIEKPPKAVEVVNGKVVELGMGERLIAWLLRKTVFRSFPI